MEKAERDVTVEYRVVGASPMKAWRAVQGDQVIIVDPVLDVVLATARRIARDEGVTAWLIASDLTIPLSDTVRAVPTDAPSE
jgi:hypothetical protein